MAMGPSDRIQLITDLMLPANCAVCFRGSDGITRFADFGLQVERYGAVYFCENCCANFGQAVDMVPASVQEDFDRVSVLLQETLEQRDNANADLALIRSFINVPDDVHISDVADAVSSESVGTDDNSEGQEGDGITESDSSAGIGLETSPSTDRPGIEL